MIFQKTTPKNMPEPAPVESDLMEIQSNDDIETVVGPSVNVEGDFASEGNIIVKGSVAGSVRTSRHLSVEQGAKILANVRAGSAQIAGEVRGNVKIKETLELTSTARVLGDVEVKTLVVAAGALIYGKLQMPGLEGVEKRTARTSQAKKSVEESEPMPIS